MTASRDSRHSAVSVGSASRAVNSDKAPDFLKERDKAYGMLNEAREAQKQLEDMLGSNSPLAQELAAAEHIVLNVEQRLLVAPSDIQAETDELKEWIELDVVTVNAKKICRHARLRLGRWSLIR